MKIALKQLEKFFTEQSVKQIVCWYENGEVKSDFVRDEDIFIKKSEAKKIIINEIIEERKKTND